MTGCGNPYLEYHHFDPPWHVKQHHDPDRMVALCAEHHAKADAWTIDQTRKLKTVAADRTEVSGKFEWMRSKVLAVIGSNFYYETPHMVVFRGQPLIWFARDEHSALLLNLRMPSTTDEPRAHLENNDWVAIGNPVDIESPPNGSFLKVRYQNGDSVEIRFREWHDAESLKAIYPAPVEALSDEIAFPLVTAEIGLTVGGTDIWFNARETHVGGLSITNCVVSHCGAGLSFD